jgi:DNA-binding transcriptional ArsR family regulator
MLFERSYLPWVPVPADGLVEALGRMSWQKPEKGSAARDVAALMIYVVLLFLRKERTATNPRPTGFSSLLSDSTLQAAEQIADATYDDLEHATGLSRSLIQQGLSRLIELGRIRASGSKQKRIYILTWPIGRWFKLPCRAVIGKDGVKAFRTFSMRTKHELNALKLYLYLADVRDRAKPYAEVSYEKIYERIGIPERDIRRAINVLTASGLLARVNRETDRIVSSWGPNMYYLTGYAELMAASTNNIPATPAA